MFSKAEILIIKRFLFSKKTEGYVSVFSWFSIIGIALGVAAIIIVMSVMNGFRSELINKIVGFNAHVTVKPYETSINLEKLNSENLKLISKELILSNSGEAIVISKNYTKGLILRGYSRENFLKLDVVKKGNLIGKSNQLTKNSISIGKELSFNLDLSVGDKVSIMSPVGIETIIGSLPRQETFIIRSIFDSGLADFDANIAFINLDTLESFFSFEKEERNLEIYLNKPSNIEEVKSKIQEIFKNEFVYSWADMNSSLFSALKVERNVMFIILSLIIIVAAFNIISGLTILVKNKTRDIAILKSIGVMNKSIVKIFFLVGVIIGTTATLFGIFLGVIFSLYIENLREFLSNTFNISLFPEEIYFLSTMPSEINPTSIFIISLCSIFITIIVSIFPAIKASKLDPVKGLKYE